MEREESQQSTVDSGPEAAPCGPGKQHGVHDHWVPSHNHGARVTGQEPRLLPKCHCSSLNAYPLVHSPHSKCLRHSVPSSPSHTHIQTHTPPPISNLSHTQFSVPDETVKPLVPSSRSQYSKRLDTRVHDRKWDFLLHWVQLTSFSTSDLPRASKSL